MKRRNIGLILAVGATFLGLGAVVMAFISNSSPYVDIAEAKAHPADNQHLSGDIVPGTVQTDYRGSRVSFQLRDEAGQTVTVDYSGAVPPNMAMAKKAVAIGGIKDGVFKSQKLLLKCPSKYESEGKS